jgi:NADH-quinone oxidoreductase subunit G
VKRGAVLVVVHARKTRLERQAAHTLRYVYGEELAALQKLLAGSSEPAAQALAAAENLVVFFGEEGMGLAQSNAAARLCADLLVSTGHAGKINSGLVGVWQNGNTQGAWELGFRPAADLSVTLGKVKAAYIAAADPAGDSPALCKALEKVDFLVVQELFLTETAKLADVVLPALPPLEREGSYTSGERRVQRFYPALPPRAEARADFAISAELGRRMGVELEGRSAAATILRIAEVTSSFAGITYQKLAETAEQVPLVGRCDLYYAGSTYENLQGLGVPLALSQKPELPFASGIKTKPVPEKAFEVVFVNLLYDRSPVLEKSALLAGRLVKPLLWIHPTAAEARGWEDGQQVEAVINGGRYPVEIRLDDSLPAQTVRAPRSTGLPEEALWTLA